MYGPRLGARSRAGATTPDKVLPPVTSIAEAESALADGADGDRIVIYNPDINSAFKIVQQRSGIPGVFQSFLAFLQKQTLLGIHKLGLGRRYIEKERVKLVDVF